MTAPSPAITTDAYESLQALQSRLTHLLQATNIVLYAFEPVGDYQVKFVSDNIAATLGHSMAAFSAPGFWMDHVHPDDLDYVYSSFHKVFASSAHHVEYRFRHGDGSWRWFSDTLRLLTNADGHPVEIVGCMMDITEHKRIADSLLDTSCRLESAYLIEQQMKHYQAIVQSSDDAIISKTVDGVISSWNPGAEKIFGYAAAEAIGRPMTMLFPGDRLAEEPMVLSKIARGQTVERFETVRIRKDGMRIHIAATISPILDGADAVVGASVIARDITEEARLRDELKILAVAFESDDGILITDADINIIRVNKAFTKITGFTKEEVLGKKPSLLKSGRHDTEFYWAMYEKLHTEGFWRGEIWDRHKDGHIYPKLSTITMVKNDAGEIINYIAVFSDISERVDAEQKIRHLAFYDALTGLPNRRLMLDRLRQKLLAENRHPDQAALLFIDLDHFKALNDTHGHEVGDQLLVDTARRLEACVRESDTVSRFGGDEFVVMLEDLGTDGGRAVTRAGTIGKKILAALSRPYALDGCEHAGSCSIGVAMFGDDAPLTLEELLRRADTAMYEAKKAGRNQLRFFDPAMQSLLEKQALLEADLRKALHHGEFRLHYQMQTDAQGAAIGAEALLRWQHLRQGLIDPRQFIGLTEETGLIVPIGQWVLDSACAQLKAWENDPRAAALRISVNISARQFFHPDFPDQVAAAVKQHAINPARLALELTENLAVRNLEETLHRMETIGALGVRFTLDDFGVGSASLAQIRRLPFHEIKIDQSLVHDIAADPASLAVVQAIICLGSALGIKVIAEGVEDAAQQRLLLEYGCHGLQGYHIARPTDLAGLTAMLKLADA